MGQKNSNDYNPVSIEPDYVYDGGKIKHTFSKFDNGDLFHEENNIKERIIRVKRITSVNNERWNIFDNNKIVFVVEGAKISKKEKEYLRTPDGFNFLIA